MIAMPPHTVPAAVGAVGEIEALCERTASCFSHCGGGLGMEDQDVARLGFNGKRFALVEQLVGFVIADVPQLALA